MTAAWLDAALLLAFAWSAWAGYRRGFILEVINLCRIVLGFALAARYGPLVGVGLQSVFVLPPLLVTPVGVVVVFLVSQFVIGWLVWLAVRPVLGAVHAFPVLGGLDRLGGLLLAVGQTALWLALAFAILLPLVAALWPSAPVGSAARASRLAPGLLALGQRLGPDLEPYVKPPSLGRLTQPGLLARQVGEDETVRLRFPPGLRLNPDPSAEQTMLAFVNEQRASNGLRPLQLDQALAGAARAHSADMFTAGYFGHVSPSGVSPVDRIDRAGARYRIVGENIAYAPTVALADSGLMRSPEHRANILRPDFTHVGIGAVSGGLFEEMFTQDFGG